MEIIKVTVVITGKRKVRYVIGDREYKRAKWERLEVMMARKGFRFTYMHTENDNTVYIYARPLSRRAMMKRISQ